MEREIHYRYAIGILIALLILLLALRYFDVKDLVDKLDFALTLTSLVLAILAIVFTATSQGKQQGQFDQLVRTNDQIRESAGEIRKLSTSISTFVAETPGHFAKIAEKIDSIGVNLDRVDDSGTVRVLPEGAPAGDDPAVPPLLSSITEADFQYLFMNLPFGGMFALYFYRYAFRKDKSFTKGEYEGAASSSFEFAMGALGLLEATGILEFKFHKDEIIPIDLAPVVDEHLTRFLDTVIRVVDEDGRKGFEEKRRSIDEFFGAADSNPIAPTAS